MNPWIMESAEYDPDTQLHTAPVYTVGNGLVCCRGFYEEEQTGIPGLGGIYMAGVFGRASYTPWKGKGHELVNLPNFLWVKITVNGRVLVLGREKVADFSAELNLLDGTLSRSYCYLENAKKLARFEFLRFASKDELYLCGQEIRVTPLVDGLSIQVECGVNTDVTNLNEVSSEPLPVQPGKKQFTEFLHSADITAVRIEKPESIRLAFGQKIETFHMRRCGDTTAQCFSVQASVGETSVLQKVITLSLSPEDGDDVVAVAAKRLADSPDFEVSLKNHKEAMHSWWKQSDIVLEGCEEDQLSLRYNILQLMQSCPRHDARYSIGARGLTGEMYEGCIFWDTEIFMLPFFTLTDPTSARNLLKFRYLTLPEARSHAASNLFRGAMYGWQVNEKGIEQTPRGVGAYYSIHVTADIAYAILEYWYCTADRSFLLDCGLEILTETARFWESRVTQREDGHYEIIAVRGPNEYGVVVNNNLYTNLMARENILQSVRIWEKISADDPKKAKELETKLNFSPAEAERWKLIAENIVLPYDERRDLWLEDDAYLRRKPLDMKKAKPTAKRIIDTTIPYEALPLYQVSKQADVLHVMKNLPWYFTTEQIEKAYRFYQPKTAFDSSLAYSIFALMAAKLGNMEDAVRYYELTANLDIQNVQRNTISGLHFANFGGTWQVVVFGFGGVSVRPEKLEIAPHLPPKWNRMSFCIRYHNSLIRVAAESGSVSVKLINAGEEPICVSLYGKDFILSNQSQHASAKMDTTNRKA